MTRSRKLRALVPLLFLLTWTRGSGASHSRANSTASPEFSSGVEQFVEERMEERVTSEESFSINRLCSPENDLDLRWSQEVNPYRVGFAPFADGGLQSNEDIQASFLTSSWNSDRAESSCTSDAVKPANMQRNSEYTIEQGSTQTDLVDHDKELLDQLIELYRKRHGELPTDDIVYRWCETFRSAISNQCRSVANQTANRFLHVSGMYVDFDRSVVYNTRAKRRSARLLPQCQHVYPDGSRCGLISSFVQFPEHDATQVTKLMVCRLHSSTQSSKKIEENCEKNQKRLSENRKKVPKKSGKSVSSVHCASPGCSRTPTYGDISAIDPAMQKALYCKRHKLPHHLNLRHFKCQHEGGCMKQALWGNPIDRVRLWCARHAKSGDMNLSEKRCEFITGCSRRAVYGLLGGKARHCRAHREHDERDLVHKHCEFVSSDGSICTTQASYGQPGGPSKFCGNHKLHCHVQTRRSTKIQSHSLSKGGYLKHTALFSSSQITPYEAPFSISGFM